MSLAILPTLVSAAPPLSAVVRDVQLKTVKIYGAGGGGRLEGYQSGFIVSPEGHIATAWSYVLDAEPIVVLDDGRRYTAELVGFEPQLELAVLKIDETNLPYFPLEESQTIPAGTAILSVSNLFGIATGDEPTSVMYGHIAATTNLKGKRGSFSTPYEESIFVLDLIANNPGAAGGAVVDHEGTLLGMLGKELQDAETGVWLNYALPASVLRPAISDVLAGRVRVRTAKSTPELSRDESLSPELLGIRLVPDVLDRTPAFVDQVIPETAAATAGLQPDDLVLLVGDIRIESQTALREALRRIDRRDVVTLTIQRGATLEIVKLSL